MKFFLTLSKKHLAIILAAIIIALIILGQFVTAKGSKINGSTNALRVQYIKSLKLEPDDSNVTSKEIVIPENFSKVYKEYNALQKKAGFDLARHRGEKATVYTYALSGSDMLVHIIVADGEIIGGDIADISFNGEMKPLCRVG